MTVDVGLNVRHIGGRVGEPPEGFAVSLVPAVVGEPPEGFTRYMHDRPS